MDDLNQRLEELALLAQSAPPKSGERRRALSQLLSVIQQSGRLGYPHRGKFKGFYHEVRDLALQGLFIYICEHIHLYSPERATVLAWANFLLSKRFFNEASREFMHTAPKGISPDFKRLSIDDLNDEISDESFSQSPSSNHAEIRQLLQSDPENIFQITHVRNSKEASFQAIALSRLEERSWQELSEELGVKVSTLSGFYQTCLDRFKPIFEKHLNS
jgi:DNA-directed RNA polymerase specialized sigma24 family protein